MLSSKIRIILLTILAIAILLINTDYTDADLFAERNISQNRFVAIVLNFFARHTANNTPVTSLFRTTGIQPGGFDIATTRIRRDGKVEFKYYLKTVKLNGDDNFCKKLKIQTYTRAFQSKYSGSLTDMNIQSTITNDTPEDWVFVVSLDDSDISLKNKLCEFNIEFRTWNTNLNETKGIFAERKLNSIVSSGNW